MNALRLLLNRHFRASMVVAFFVLGNACHLFAQGTEPITVEKIYTTNLFNAEYIYGINWMNDGQFYTSRQGNDIVKYDVTTGEVVETLVSGSSLSPSIRFSSYAFSADEQKILFLTDRERIYRRSFKAQYFVYDMATKQLQPLSDGGPQSYATFSPDGGKVAFTRDNNLFYVDLSDMKEVQVTQDGRFNEVIHGSADWVYEEEFGFAKAFFWSPDSRKIAFYTFDEREVPEYNMQVWGNSHMVYPFDYRFKYPKAGEKNSVVSLSVYDLGSSKTVKAATGDEPDSYIARVEWTQDPNTLSAIHLNRLQNEMTLLHIDAATGKSKAILTEKSETYVDVEYTDDLTYLADGKQFLHTSEKDGYKHIYLYRMDGTLVQQVTKGEWEVTELVGISEGKKTEIFYISTEASPLERHFYKIDLKKGKKEKLSDTHGTYEVNMSKDFKYYIMEYSHSDQPPVTSLYSTAKNKLIKVLEDNGELVENTAKYGFVKKDIFSFPTTDGTELYGYMLTPSNFDSNKKYPVLMFVYGGPGSVNVADAWSGGANHAWHQMLVQKGYVVAVVDNRGTGARGRDFRHITYGKLGKYETEDQIAAAKHLASMDFIDEERIGIWGWSYGGYMSSLCILLGTDVFKTAIAVAPVTSWRYYDTIYTERYLMRPQDNPSGYDDYSPLSHADKLEGNYLLVHGTGDDNVHFQNAVSMQNALIAAGKQFDTFFYPDRNHGIYGGNTRLHLFNMLTEYILEKL